jgi:hypothetical protein
MGFPQTIGAFKGACSTKLFLKFAGYNPTKQNILGWYYSNA